MSKRSLTWDEEKSFIIDTLRKTDLTFLSDREREVVYRYYGLGGWIPHTLGQIGMAIKSTNIRHGSVGRERIRQIKDRALVKIKKYLECPQEKNS